MVINSPYSSSMEKEVRKAANIINSFFRSTVDADSAIPAELIRNCTGLAFLTVVKAGMIWTGKLGTGVVIARLDDGSWSAPSGIGTAGVGFGAEIGGEIIDFMIVLGSRSAVKTFKKGTQVSVGAGLDLAVGPVGRTAGANMNAGKGGLSGNYTYSHTKGVFAGIGLHGSTIMVRGEMNNKFYGREVSPMEILSGHVQPPAGTCECLYEAIRQAESQEGISVYPSTDARSPHFTPDTATKSSSQRDSTSSSRNNSFDRLSFRSSSSSVSSSQPIENDPRLRKSNLYRTQEEMLAEYAKNKSTQATTATAGSSAGNGGAAAAASTAYAVSSAYSTPQAPAAPTSAYGAAAQPSTYQPQAPQPLPRPVTYSSYSVPVVGAAAAPPQPPPIPSAAVGAETKQVYMQVMNFISTRCPHANLQTFKDNCRLFGQDQMSLDAYFAYLVSLCSTNLLKELMPQLVRLLPTAEKRERLWALYVRDVLLIR